MNLVRRTAVAIACFLGLVAFNLMLVTPCRAGSIPAWLDDSITAWNTENPSNPIQFVDIKDSYVWYRMATTPELDSKEIRARVYGIAHRNGYANTQDEEIVTTGKPPTASGQKKCWTRSLLRDVQQGSSTTVERMLTTLVCEDSASWYAGFRILQ